MDQVVMNLVNKTSFEAIKYLLLISHYCACFCAQCPFCMNVLSDWLTCL